MAMTKADFTEIADAVAEARRVVEFYSSGQERAFKLSALETVTKELATACARQYRGGYGFKRDTFVEACGFPEA